MITRLHIDSLLIQKLIAQWSIREIPEMSTRHRSRTCKNCGDLPIQQFTPELRSECRACYNSKRRQQNILGSQQLKQGTWIESSELSSLYAQIETLQAQITTLAVDRSVVDQKLQAEISAKEQCLTHNQQLKDQILALQAQISAPTLDRPVIDQLEHQLSETTQRLTRLETLLRDTQTQTTQLLGLISAPSEQLLSGEEISTQLSTLSHLIPDRSVVDQVKTVMTEQFGAFQRQLTSQSLEIGRLQQLIQVQEAPLPDRSEVDHLEQKIQDRLQARDLQLAELLSQLKLQSDQISSLIIDRSGAPTPRNGEVPVAREVPEVDQRAPNSTFLTPPRQSPPAEDPMSAEPSAVTVHPELTPWDDSRLTTTTSSPRPRPTPEEIPVDDSRLITTTSSTTLGPIITEKMHQLHEHGLPLSTPPRLFATVSAKKFPVINQPFSVKK